MRRVLAVSLLLILAGCGLPPAFTIVSYALDGLSFLSTGKSVSDHAISAVADRDCAMWRVIKGELVCKDYKEGEHGILVAFADKWKEGVANDEFGPFGDEQPAGQVGASDGQVVETFDDGDPVIVPNGMADLLPALSGVAALAPSPDADATAFAALSAGGLNGFGGFAGARGADSALLLSVPPSSGWQPVLRVSAKAGVPATAAPPPAGDAVLVIGSFASRANALRAATGWRGLDPMVAPARVAGRTWFRVVAGPYRVDSLAARKRALAARGLRDAWTARLCPAGGGRAGCVMLPGGPGA